MRHIDYVDLHVHIIFQMLRRRKKLMIPELNTDNKVVGTKQVKRALLNDKAKTVYLAEDADSKIKNEITTMAEEKQVPIVYVESMEKLGKSCKIDVNAATAALLK